MWKKMTNRTRFKLNCLQQHVFENHANGKDIVKASDSKSHSWNYKKKINKQKYYK